jgi:ABC-type transport system involved in multi-copper enzyme maturation permease subunit
VLNADPGDLIAVSALVAGIVLILVVWLNLGLVYPLLAGLGIGIFTLGQLLGFELTGSIIFGMITLTLVFMVLMRGFSLALSFAHPVLAIARNVLAEAIRMKISLVFIVLLFFVLAALPMLLNDNESLRYRVQSFLEYATGFTFLFVAMLVVFFGAATVSYEQREKVIWQTMTKPVAAWQYVLGKWLGVVTLAAILLCVSAIGVFEFTEYLRWQPAQGERTAFSPLNEEEGITEDRLKLETQVLASRVAIPPAIPFSFGDEQFDQAIQQHIENERRTNPDYSPDSAERRALRERMFRDELTQYLSIDPNAEQYETYTFGGLQEAKRLNLPLTLRYKINAEGNRPDITYLLTFVFEDGTILPPRRTGLGFSHYMTIPSHLIDNQGLLQFQLYNGQLVPDGQGYYGLQTNINTATIPPDGLEISYSVGSYRMNFVRVYFVLWVKLALLAMLAVWASTFASFPVACLIAGGVFFMGETAGFVQGSLPGWGKTTVDGDPSLYRSTIYYFADYVSRMFSAYNNLRPAKRLAQGELLSWGRVAGGLFTLGVATLLFYGIGVLIFRRRQLAIYSGN